MYAKLFQSKATIGDKFADLTMALKKDATEYGWVYVFDGMKQVSEWEADQKKTDAKYTPQDYSDGYTMQAVLTFPVADVNGGDNKVVGFAAQSTFKKDDVDKVVVTAVSVKRTYSGTAATADSFAFESYTGASSIEGLLTADLAGVTKLSKVTATAHVSKVLDGHWEGKLDSTASENGADFTGSYNWSAVRLLPTEKKDAALRFTGKETRTNVLYIWASEAAPTVVFNGTWKSSASALSAAAVALLAINSF